MSELETKKTHEDFSEEIYHKPVCIIPSLLCCWPLGLGLLWTSSIEKNIKIVSTLIITLLVFIGTPISLIIMNSFVENVEQIQYDYE